MGSPSTERSQILVIENPITAPKLWTFEGDCSNLTVCPMHALCNIRGQTSLHRSDRTGQQVRFSQSALFILPPGRPQAPSPAALPCHDPWPAFPRPLTHPPAPRLHLLRVPLSFSSQAKPCMGRRWRSKYQVDSAAETDRAKNAKPSPAPSSSACPRQ